LTGGSDFFWFARLSKEVFFGVDIPGFSVTFLHSDGFPLRYLCFLCIGIDLTSPLSNLRTRTSYRSVAMKNDFAMFRIFFDFCRSPCPTRTRTRLRCTRSRTERRIFVARESTSTGLVNFEKPRNADNSFLDERQQDIPQFHRIGQRLRLRKCVFP
uniref:Secreted protein n=1 Tax=Haemonchus placei TaxID=6290 RepID=A0A158QKL7_HAEPC